MTGRERFLTAINNQKPDYLPCQVHSWMGYYLKKYIKGCDQYDAYKFFNMDPVIYILPDYLFDSKDKANWQEKYIDLGIDKNGYKNLLIEITTPEGVLKHSYASNQFTAWETELLVKDEKDMELFIKYFPVPNGADWTPVIEAKKRIGNTGITRGLNYNFGQPGVWQSFTYLIGTEKAIYKAIDEPDYVHYVLKSMTNKNLKSLERIGKIESDLVENGGGSASSTVISPQMHIDFCLPYDTLIHKAIKACGTKVVYHLCGGHMPLLETVVKNGTDCLETLTPLGMGADCRLAEAKKRVGDKIGFIGGLDQNAGFEKGNPKLINKMVHELFEACPNGGYICSPSDHFFEGAVENVKAFVDACKECKY